jgi:hypothetical protein
MDPYHQPPPPFVDPTDVPGESVHHTEQLDRAALRRPAGGTSKIGEGLYRSRQPAMMAVLVAIIVVYEVVAIRLLGAALFGQPIQVGGSIASALLTLGLPMFGFGIHALLGGGATAPGAGARVWLRTPLVYLPMALILFLAAGLAAN